MSKRSSGQRDTENKQIDLLALIRIDKCKKVSAFLVTEAILIRQFFLLTRYTVSNDGASKPIFRNNSRVGGWSEIPAKSINRIGFRI